MTFNQAPALNTKCFENDEDFLFKPEIDSGFYAREADLFADRQIDSVVEEIEMRSARSFSSSVKAGAVPTRRLSIYSRSTHVRPGPPWRRRRRYPRPMPSLLLAILAAVGLLLALFTSNASRCPSPAVEIKTIISSTVTYPIIEQSPAPLRPSPIHPVKMPRKPQPPALLTSTDPTPIPTPPLTSR